MRHVLLILICFYLTTLSAQTENEKQLKQVLNLKEIIWDTENGDGIFLAQSKETKKWGMYQQLERGKRPKKLVSMRYDSLGFFGFNGGFTVVKKEGKYGVISDPWSGDGSHLLLRTKYEFLKYVNYEGVEILASRQNGKWGYLNFENGDTLVPFEHDTFEELPLPARIFYRFPRTVYPEKLTILLANPDTVTKIDLSYLSLRYLPPAIGKCKNAVEANLEGNLFSTLPNAFFELKNLKHLYLGSNPQLLNFDERFGQLKNLETLFIGRISCYGRSEKYLETQLYFKDALSQLTNLKTLVIHAYFGNDAVPDFVYNLPNLDYLNLSTRSLTPLYYDLSKLSCKTTLKELSLGILSSIKNWNANIQIFPNLEEIHLTIMDMVGDFESINKIPKLISCHVIGYQQIDSSNSYSVNTVMDFSMNTFRGKPMTTEQRKEAIEKWNAFVTNQ